MLILVRFSGDISTKAKQTRLRFTRRLTDNMADAFASENIPFELDRRWSRLFIETPSDRALEVLKRVCGVQSFSVVERRPGRALQEIVSAGEELFRERVADKSFAVRARRGGNKSEIPFTSKDIENGLGTALLPYAREVDLDDPECTVHVEVREGQAYFFTEQIAGPGGLPIGVEGRAVALVSGGFDSAVAAWYMLRRGVALDYVFCQLGGSTHLQGTLRVLKVLSDRWGYGYQPRLHVLDFRPLVEELRANTRTRYWQLVLKRLMYRAAERIARASGRLGIVTGEVIGQVSSQTLHNLDAISQAVDIPLLRPLLGFDKQEIIRRAWEIGTHDLSADVKEYCAIVPNQPATRASRQEVEQEEEKLDLELLARVIDERDVFDLRGLDLETWEEPDVEIEEVPEEATIIDVRPRFAYEAWHYPGAEHMEFSEAFKKFKALDENETYVICCRIGLKSAHLAERMRHAGYRAYSVKGGMKTLMRQAVERDLVPLEMLPEGAVVLD